MILHENKGEEQSVPFTGKEQKMSLLSSGDNPAVLYFCLLNFGQLEFLFLIMGRNHRNALC